MMRSYLQFKTFLRIRMRASMPWKSKCCNTDEKSWWTTGETILKNKLHLVKFDHCIIVQPMNFSAHPHSVTLVIHCSEFDLIFRFCKLFSYSKQISHNIKVTLWCFRSNTQHYFLPSFGRNFFTVCTKSELQHIQRKLIITRPDIMKHMIYM